MSAKGWTRRLSALRIVATLTAIGALGQSACSTCEGPVTDTSGQDSGAPTDAPAVPAAKAPLDPHFNRTPMLLEELAVSDGVSGVRFGPNGHHVAWIQRLATDRSRVVLDGALGREYLELTYPQWSSDGLQFVYAANASNAVMKLSGGDVIAKQWFVETGVERYGPFQSVSQVRVASNGSVSWQAVLKPLPRTNQTVANETMFVDGVADPTFLSVPVRGAVYDADGKLAAYRAKSGAGWHVVVRGKVMAAHDRVGQPALSPNGKHVAYAAGTKGSKTVNIIHKGTVYPTSFSDFTSLVVTNDGVAAGVGDQRMLVLNVAEPSTWRRVDDVRWLHVRPSGISYAYRKADTTTLVVDGQRTKLPKGIDINTVSLSPQAAGKPQRWMASTRGKAGSEVLVDGEAWPSVGALEAPTWSGDGTRFGYRLVVAQGPNVKRTTIVVDKTTYGPFKIATTPLFAPRGKRFAFVAKRAGEDFRLWVDGQERTKEQANPLIDLRWSPDGQMLARPIIEGGRHRWAVDQRKSGPFDQVYGGRFSSDGQRFGAGVRDSKALKWWVLTL